MAHPKPHANTVTGQKEMFHSAGNMAARKMLADYIAGLEAERRLLYKAWSAGGKTDALWAPVAANDAVQASQGVVMQDLGGWP